MTETLTNRSLIDLDRDHLIHPVASFRGHEAHGARVLASGDGMWLTDMEGKRVIDGFAGLWCVNVGYGQDSIVEAAADQMRRLPYATGYFHFASEAAIRLAAELTALTPEGLNHVYFTQGGSDSVDSAVRYIVHYFNAIGKPDKKEFIALEWGYHGSSAMGAGLTALANFHRGFDLPYKWQHHIASPYPYRHPNGHDDAAVIASTISALEAKVAEIGADKVAAFCCEPIQGSGGVIVPPVGWLKAIREACDRLGILLLVDEVITGFGRTGPLFACEAEGVTPDFMTTAKGLTSGYAPMGALFMADHIYQAIADASPLPVGHGGTYSGHPVAAAVGLEVLRLYREGGVLANGVMVGERFAARMEAIRSHPLVGDVRYRGLLGAIELVANKDTKAPFAADLALGDRLSQMTWDNGVIVRCFANAVIGFAPALICTPEEMDIIFDRVQLTLDQLLDQADIRAAIGQ
ncbi:aminotransferase class III-fold pyridoxal phosphate-dependent enzyme [Novosphingobium sp. KACC 22771]|uniref:aminotransferase class III-fold pyridoxal phosphate-dependent enzyme n=1 Tax=Novosphingobium sp. KACC 22771 TaxID=3025670 RepID=UPI0023656138|nr:aminotransferase class III-fold pyridoxal phosphate-dependent enzyme [Novosphingobium sp. KACC 22771]WDF71524.1 aminotransferase class III-fold pyridoxal phosphate-dependent enzyme [Novosphingobium sp. KACC 22771]